VLINVEIDVDRIDLDDCRELGRPACANEGAGVRKPRRNDSVEWSDDGRIFEIALGLIDLTLGLASAA